MDPLLPASMDLLPEVPVLAVVDPSFDAVVSDERIRGVRYDDRTDNSHEHTVLMTNVYMGDTCLSYGTSDRPFVLCHSVLLRPAEVSAVRAAQ